MLTQVGSAQEEGGSATASTREEPSADDKPVRVRAGFQVYQPKPRTSRLSSADEAADVQPPEATGKSGAAAKAAKSGAPAGASKTGAANSGASDAAKSGASTRCNTLCNRMF